MIIFSVICGFLFFICNKFMCISSLSVPGLALPTITFSLYNSMFIIALSGAFGIFRGLSSFFIVKVLLLALVGSNLDLNLLGYVLFYLGLPVVVASFYFSKKFTSSLTLVAFAILAFNFISNGDAFLYSLFWVIPFITYFFSDNNLIRSLGATFSAHAMGSLVWLICFNPSSEYFLSLMPMVMVERTFIALGITGFYFAFCKFQKLSSVKNLSRT